MDYCESMSSLEQEGFLWHRLREYFPFGAVALGEGDYQRLLTACLNRLPDEQERERLLDLLDMQAATFLEQCWVQDEMDSKQPGSKLSNGSDELGRFGMAAHLAAAWLQCDSNLRGRQRARRPNLRSILLDPLSDGSLSQLLMFGARTSKEVG